MLTFESELLDNNAITGSTLLYAKALALHFLTPNAEIEPRSIILSLDGRHQTEEFATPSQPAGTSFIAALTPPYKKQNLRNTPGREKNKK